MTVGDALSPVGVDTGVEPVEEGGIEVLISARTGFLLSGCFAGAAAATAAIWRFGSAGCILSCDYMSGDVPAQAGMKAVIYILFVAATESKQKKGRRE